VPGHPREPDLTRLATLAPFASQSCTIGSG
jgi:hypothetical protein